MNPIRIEGSHMPSKCFSHMDGRTGRADGFGLIELIIVIAIIAILTAMATPSFSALIRENRVKTQANDFLSASNYARNEAITRSRGVTLCAADTREGALPTACGTSADWGKGWMVFVDDTVGSAATPVAIDNADVLRTWEANPKNTFVPGSAISFVRYNPRGLTNNITADVSFTLKPASNCSARQQRTIVISPLGRSSSAIVETCS
ncbi:MAG: GspH/FimT family protein [Dokdonella sp.]|nr:GspH/FimT family pseudopilin [Xanthomonadales bacterium]